MRKSWVQLTIFYLFVTAATGVLMRSMALFPLPGVQYEYILHAHSHLAILGWGYMALFLLYMDQFFKERKRNDLQIKHLFWITQLTIVGMFLAFSLQGYALFSILFSSVQIFLSYWFAILVWRQLRQREQVLPTSPVSFLFVKGSLLCLVLSSLGPWTLAILSANQLNETPWFDMAVYFYLHFQYNGWFTLGLIAVLLHILEKRSVSIPGKWMKLQFWLYSTSLLPAFFISILWYEMDRFWHIVAAAGAGVQWVAIVLLCVLLFRVRSFLRHMFAGGSGTLLVLSLVTVVIKATLEIGPVIPGLTDLVYQSRSIVIGYLHLTLLGFVSFLCLALFLHKGWLSLRVKTAQTGYGLFVIGWGIKEVVLFWQGLYDWTGLGPLDYGREGLWLASIAMALGIGLLAMNSNEWPKSMYGNESLEVSIPDSRS